MKENDKFPEPIITPATKAEEGHDEDISREEILSQGIVEEEIYIQLENITRKLFERGTQMAAERGLILVDTKYEFGLLDGKVVLIDEIHTPDSSRYFYADGYEERQAKGLAQRQLSKSLFVNGLLKMDFKDLKDKKCHICQIHSFKLFLNATLNFTKKLPKKNLSNQIPLIFRRGLRIMWDNICLKKIK